MITQSPVASESVQLDAVIVKVEEFDRDGKLVHESDFTGEFPDRQAAAAAIEPHLRQFGLSGYNLTADFWWGRSSSGHETRFFIR
jgi:hypothetical protein